MLDIYTMTLIFKDKNGIEVGRIKASNTKAEVYAEDMQKNKQAVKLEIKGWNGWKGDVTFLP